MGRRLILADGTKIENGEAGYAGSTLWCIIPGWTLSHAAQVFTNPAKTAEIRFEYGEMEDVYRGFTTCTNIMTDGERVSVCLVKG